MSSNRKEARATKAAAVVKRLEEIHDSREILIGMLDEHKLDLIILALGIGEVSLDTPAGSRPSQGSG